MHNPYETLAQKPVFFERNRVARVYTGGKLFADFFGDAPEDGFLPEEWIASCVRALNRDSGNPKEGISRVRGTDIYFDKLLEAQKARMLGSRTGLCMLTKVLDSAIRLPVQAHPDKAFSRLHFQSGFGKAEAWIVLATRKDARIYFGFKEGVTREAFAEAVRQSLEDKGAMERLLMVTPAKTGDIYFIPPKAVHAIGYGCLILEVQEPTDFTIQPEAWCGDYLLSNYEQYLGLAEDTALDCFDFSLCGKDAIALGRQTPTIIRKESGLLCESLIGSRQTTCFALNRHTISGGMLGGLAAPAVYIVTRGSGTLFDREVAPQPLQKGDYFFLPACIDKACRICSDSLELIECLPPAL